MESTIKRAFDKTVNADGSISLRFKLTTSAVGTGFKLVQGYVIFGVVPAVAVFLAAYSFLQDAFGRSSTIALTLGAICGILTLILGSRLAHKIVSGSHEILIFPAKGIKWGRTQLSMADIQSIGVKTHAGTSYIFARALGKDVKLSRYMEPALADTIAHEIRVASGSSWS